MKRIGQMVRVAVMSLVLTVLIAVNMGSAQAIPIQGTRFENVIGNCAIGELNVNYLIGTGGCRVDDRSFEQVELRFYKGSQGLTATVSFQVPEENFEEGKCTASELPDILLSWEDAQVPRVIQCNMLKRPFLFQRVRGDADVGVTIKRVVKSQEKKVVKD